tara:strand:+ start:1404 stop:1682 length:279 start_codon:yes stop_codon:yes gene_type:complete
MKKITAIYNKSWNGYTFPKLCSEAPELIKKGMITNIMYTAGPKVPCEPLAALNDILSFVSMTATAIQQVKEVHDIGEIAYSAEIVITAKAVA